MNVARARWWVAAIFALVACDSSSPAPRAAEAFIDKPYEQAAHRGSRPAAATPREPTPRRRAPLQVTARTGTVTVSEHVDGDAVVTGPDGAASIDLPNDVRIRVKAGSRLVRDPLVDNAYHLVDGEVVVYVAAKSSANRMPVRVATRDATTVWLGTGSGAIRVPRTGKPSLTMTTGTAHVWLGDERKLVHAGKSAALGVGRGAQGSRALRERLRVAVAAMEARVEAVGEADARSEALAAEQTAALSTNAARARQLQEEIIANTLAREAEYKTLFVAWERAFGLALRLHVDGDESALEPLVQRARAIAPLLERAARAA